MSTVQDVINSARYATDNLGTDQGGTDAVFVTLVAEDYLTTVKKFADIIPNRYTKRATVTITAGNSEVNIIGTATDFWKPRKVTLIGADGSRTPVVECSVHEIDLATTPRYMIRGAGTLVVFPAASAPGNYEILYLYLPPNVTAVGSTLDLPDGCHRSLSTRLAGRIRSKSEDADEYTSRADKQLAEDLEAAAKEYPERSAPGVSDVSGIY